MKVSKSWKKDFTRTRWSLEEEAGYVIQILTVKTRRVSRTVHWLNLVILMIHFYHFITKKFKSSKQFYYSNSWTAPSQMGNIRSWLEGVRQSDTAEDSDEHGESSDGAVEEDIDRVIRQISLAVSRSRGVSSLSRAVAKVLSVIRLFTAGDF